ncbi:MAG: ABC transporter permease [Synergistaceae bacterium]|jgi:NitT/TauT family transport system permease protein|nr:ABC transporter permease [Synergistaceae bacterium]
MQPAGAIKEDTVSRPLPGEKAPYRTVKFLNFLLDSGIVSWFLLFAAWSAISRFYNATFFPSPLETIVGSWEVIADGTLLKFSAVSLWRVFQGWLIGSAVAVPVGVAIGRSRITRKIMEPLVDYFRFIPAIAYLTLFIMWFGVGERSKVLLIVYNTFFLVVINTASGVLSIESNRIQAARTLGTSEPRILFFVVLPECVPFIFTGVRLGLGGAFTSIIAAEMLAAKEGLGYLIFTSRLYFRVDWILAGVIMLGLLGYLTDKLFRVFGSFALKRYGIYDAKEFGQ